MASNSSNDSKTKNEDIVKEKDASTVPTSYGLQTANQSTKSNDGAQYLKPYSMLDQIPFVLSTQTNIDFDSYDRFIDGMKNYLQSVKNVITSDVYDYDFSNEKKIVAEGKKHAK